MRRLRPAHLALALAGVALFVALGGPAYAAKLLDGKTIKNGSIAGSKLADGAVGLKQLAASVPAALRGAPGATGPAGASGAKGATGPRGASGALDVMDAQNRRIGTFAGYYSTIMLVRNDAGALLAYDGNVSSGTPVPLGGTTVFYKQLGCAGQAYVQAGALALADVATIPASPAAVGSPIWHGTATTPSSFSSPSQRTSAGCVNSSTSASLVVPAADGGTVPAVQKPLTIVPRG